MPINTPNLPELDFEPPTVTTVETKDTRTVTCYNSRCADYRTERPYGTKCKCQEGIGRKVGGF